MAHVLVRHSVQDYGEWKPVFDDVVDIRKAGGEEEYQIYHTDSDANDLVLLFQWDTLDHARKFFQSPDLREAMHNAGVIGPPEVIFLDGVEEGTI